jgi:hypothetical protein
MSDNDYLKCSCEKCGGHIEFSPVGVGQLVDCPHCGGQTQLISISDKSPAKSGGKFVIVGGLILIVFILAGAGVIFYWSLMRTPAVVTPITSATAATNTAPPKAFTELNEFKVGKITLEKIEGGGLVYAVGTVKNDTTRQRFGVKIELDLIDAQDDKIGSASDYIDVLEPHKEWQFKAMLTEPKAVKATPADIEEQK